MRASTAPWKAVLRFRLCASRQGLHESSLNCASSPKHTVHPVSDALCTDIIWWLYFLSHYNGVSVIPSDVIILNPELFATEACLTSCGAVCFGECFHREFPDFILTQDRHINELELLTVVISIKLWAPKLQGLGVELLSDNATCVSVINSQSSSNVFMQRCLRELWLLSHCTTSISLSVQFMGVIIG